MGEQQRWEGLDAISAPGCQSNIAANLRIGLRCPAILVQNEKKHNGGTSTASKGMSTIRFGGNER